MEDMGRIQQARQRRRAEREEEFLHGDEPPWVRRWANPLEDLSFTAQEVGCLGKEVSRGVAVEASGGTTAETSAFPQH